jgi:DNA ligase-1
MTHPILYHQGKKNALYSWKIWVEEDEIVTEHGLVDGKKQEARKKATPKNVGRANETTAKEQAVKEALAMWVFKKERKYSETREGAQQTLFLPMLAKDFFKRESKVVYPVDVQPKLDGVRALASWEGHEVVVREVSTWVGNGMTLTSRGGKLYDVPHLSAALALRLPKGCVLDGEIYCHNKTFQEITRLVKKHRPGESETLQYWFYDMPLSPRMPPDSNWPERKTQMIYWDLTENDSPSLVLTPTTYANSKEEVEAAQAKFVEDGYEGGIVRQRGVFPYIFGYRSDGLLKVKSFMDAEYKVTGWTFGVGRFADVPTWVCTMEDGQTFRCLSKGSMEARREMGQNADSYVGQMLKVCFFEKTEDNIPRFPIGVGFRMPEDMD